MHGIQTRAATRAIRVTATECGIDSVPQTPVASQQQGPTEEYHDAPNVDPSPTQSHSELECPFRWLRQPSSPYGQKYWLDCFEANKSREARADGSHVPLQHRHNHRTHDALRIESEILMESESPTSALDQAPSPLSAHSTTQSQLQDGHLSDAALERYDDHSAFQDSNGAIGGSPEINGPRKGAEGSPDHPAGRLPEDSSAAAALGSDAAADELMMQQMRSEALGIRVRKTAPTKSNLSSPLGVNKTSASLDAVTIPRSKTGLTGSGVARKAIKSRRSDPTTKGPADRIRSHVPSHGRDSTGKFIPGYKRITESQASRSPAPGGIRQIVHANADAEFIDDETAPAPGTPLVSGTPISENGEDPYCWCGGTDDGTIFVGCDLCDGWYHSRCIGVDMNERVPIIAEYTCARCLGVTIEDPKLGPDDKRGLITWKRLCRFGGCMEPARYPKEGGIKSKYCSDQHGIQFMRQKAGLDVRGRLQDPRDSHDWRSNVGGRLSVQELKALVNGVQSIDQFHTLGRPPPTPSPDDSDQEVHSPSKRNNLGPNHFAELRRKLDDVQHRSALLEDIRIRNIRLVKLLQQHPENSKMKGLCGYDRRLAAADVAELPNEADEAGSLVASEILAEACSDNSVKGEYMGVCFERRCRRHMGWDNMLQQELAHERSVLIENLEHPKADIREEGGWI